MWKRIGKSPIQPFDLSDPIDLFVVSTRKNDHFGQFVFPKSVLFEKGVLSNNGQGGKNAMRVYPSWDKTENKQAQQTQEWQLKYFFEISENQEINIHQAKRLYTTTIS